MTEIKVNVELTGELAELTRQVAEVRGWTVDQVLAHVLAGGIPVEQDVNDATATACETWPLPQRSTQVKVQPTSVNEGANGFHLATFVSDGYGNIVSEDAGGSRIASVAYDPDKAATGDTDTESFVRLAKVTVSSLADRYRL